MGNFNPISNFSQNNAILLRNLQRNQININRTLERLSTGLRVNSAADDPLGITLARRTDTQLIGNRQAIRETQQAISITDTANAGANAILTNLQRLRELSVSAATDTNSSQDRLNIQNEANQLIADIDRIVSNTRFNTRDLLDGDSAGARSNVDAFSEILFNFTYSNSTNNDPFDFVRSVNVPQDVYINDTLEFIQTLDPATNVYSLEIRSADQGTVAFYNDIGDSPTTYNIPFLTQDGSTANVRINRSPFNFDRVTGPLTNAELNAPLQELVNSDRISPVNYGTLQLGLGQSTYNIGVSSGSTLQGLLDNINALSTATNPINASYDPSTGLFNIDYTGQESFSNTNVTAYSIADPPEAGGPFADFASVPAPAQGPAYPAVSIAGPGFSVAAPPANFPGLPGALDTSFNFTGTAASVQSIFGLVNAGNTGTVTAYTDNYFGETVATSTPSEYVNRTRVVVDDVTAEQVLAGADTGLSAADANLSFRALGTAQVTSAALPVGDFSIDFGANGVFNFAGFDPNSNTIEDVVNAINAFGAAAPGSVSASFDVGSDQLTISNTPPTVNQPRVNDPGLAATALSIDFGDNGVFNFSFDPNTDTIDDIVNSINAFGAAAPGSVNASFDPVTDQITINNTPLSQDRTRVDDPGLVSTAFSIDFGENGIFNGTLDINTDTIQDFVDDINNYGGALPAVGAVSASYDESTDQLTISNNSVVDNQITFDAAGDEVRQFFKLSNVGNTFLGLQSTVSSGDIDNSSIDPSLDIGAADVGTLSFNDLVTDLVNVPEDNQIVFDANGNALRQFFDLSNTASTGAGGQTVSSAGDIDNSATDIRLDIAPGDVATLSLTDLVTPINLPQENQITFGGANGANIASFFNLSSVGDDGSGNAQAISSSSSISNAAVDPSLDITAADVSGTSFNALRTARLNTVVSGDLVINGQTVLTIDPDANSINDVLSALNTVVGPSNRNYSANFDAAVSGGLQITVQDIEILSPAGSQPAADPGVQTITGNQITLDSAAYFADGAPVFEQPTLDPTPLPAPYVTVAPTLGGVSNINFGGSTNIASVINLSDAASGSATLLSSLYQGTANPTSHNTYDLNATQEDLYEASSSTTSSSRVGFDSSEVEETDLPEDGVVARVRIFSSLPYRVEDNALEIQVGANEGNSLRLSIEDLSSESLRLEGLDIFEAGDSDEQAILRAENAQFVVDRAIDTTLSVLSQLGATQGRLERNFNFLNAKNESLIQSLSSYQDADVAQEISNLTQAQLNVQVGSALLAQNTADVRSTYNLLFGNMQGISKSFLGF